MAHDPSRFQRAFGWDFEREDRDNLARTSQDAWRSAVRGQYAAPEEMDPRPWLRRTDQLRQGACRGFTLSHAGQFCYHAATGEVMEFSQQFAYIECQRRDGLIGRDAGATIDGGEHVAKNVGFASLPLWPYLGTYHTSPPGRSIDEVRKEARTRLIRTSSSLRSYDEIFEWLASGLGCVEIGITWNDSMEAGPVIESYDPWRSGGGHALLLCGFSRRKDVKGRKYLWMANWWGRHYGNDGYAEIAPAVVESWYRNKYTVIRGQSDLEGDGVQPRPVDWATNPYKRGGRYRSTAA